MLIFELLQYELFTLLMVGLTPWCSGPHGDALALRLFRFYDTSGTGMLTYRDLCVALSIILRDDLTHRLRLLYQLHLPPCLLPGEGETPSPVDPDEPEVAKDASEFFGSNTARQPAVSRIIGEETAATSNLSESYCISGNGSSSNLSVISSNGQNNNGSEGK